MKIKKSANSQIVRCMCYADTRVPHNIRDEYILQFSQQLAEIAGTKEFVR